VPDVVTCLWGRAGVDRAAQGLLGAGRRLADSLQGKLRAVVLGPADESLVAAAQIGADTVVLIEDELLMEIPVTPRHEVCPQPTRLSAADPDFDSAEAARPNPFAVLGALRSDKSGKG